MRALAVSLLLLVGCSDTTGGGLVTFAANVGGPANANGALEFDTGSGYHVVLSDNPPAVFHIGAIYLNMSVPSSGGAEQPCILPGIYVGEVFGSCGANGRCGVDFDPLSSTLVPFPIAGNGTAGRAVEAEVWLSGVESNNEGDINATDDPTPILQVTGTASRAGMQWPFSATVTIGANRQTPVADPAMPGANPICRQRIVSPIPVNLTLSDGGTLDVRVDPSGMFNGVDFSQLNMMNGTYVIPDQSGGIGENLYKGVVANSGVYQFTFAPK